MDAIVTWQSQVSRVCIEYFKAVIPETCLFLTYMWEMDYTDDRRWTGKEHQIGHKVYL